VDEKRWLVSRRRPGVPEKFSGSLRQWFHVNLSEFPIAPFALHANGAGQNIAALGFVHQLAIDVGFDGVAAADDFVGVLFSALPPTGERNLSHIAEQRPARAERAGAS
jgi:hypothetical protein